MAECVKIEARSAREVADAIASALAEGRRIAVEGAGTKAGVGRPFEADMVLSTAGLAGVVAYEPSELVLTARAGTPLAEVEALLDSRGQRLAFEPMDFGPLLGGPAGRATLAGTLAAGASGPRRIKAGAARDHLLGFEAVSGRGEPFKAGGKVVKNVTGYDLSKLMAGSWGTLAVMTEVTVKVMPRPPEATTLLVFGDDERAAAAAMSAALGAPAEVTGAAHLPAAVAARAPLARLASAGAGVTLLRIEGVAPALASAAAAIGRAVPGLEAGARLDGEETARLWRWVRDVEAFAADGDARQVWRLSVAPMDGPAAVAAVRAETRAEAFYDWAGGLVWLACADDPDAGAAVRRAAIAVGGHATLVRAAADSRRVLGAFQPEPAPLAALTRRIKAGFDPKGVLNPGRMWPEPQDKG